MAYGSYKPTLFSSEYIFSPYLNEIRFTYWFNMRKNCQFRHLAWEKLFAIYFIRSSLDKKKLIRIKAANKLFALTQLYDAINPINNDHKICSESWTCFQLTSLFLLTKLMHCAVIPGLWEVIGSSSVLLRGYKLSIRICLMFWLELAWPQDGVTLPE